MAKLRSCAYPVLLLAALQAGCTDVPVRSYAVRSIPAPIRPACDTSVKYIELVGSIQNTTGAAISFHLDGDRGPPYDPWYLGYRVHSSAPGEPFQVVHNSGHDSEWTRTLTIAPGDSAVFSIPIFGLRPADYLRYFRIELRDSNRRSYWTPAFELCTFAPANCGCPRPGAPAVGLQAPRQACPVVPLATAANDGAKGAIGGVCP
jgi:hypothetical protein